MDTQLYVLAQKEPIEKNYNHGLLHIVRADNPHGNALCGRQPHAKDVWGWHMIRALIPGKSLKTQDTHGRSVCFQCETIYERNVRTDEHIHGTWTPSHSLPDLIW